MSEALFENPTYIYLSLGFAVLVLAAVWYERRSKGLIWAMAIPVVLGLCVVVVAHLVVTDREQIAAAARGIAEAAESRNFQEIPQHIDDSFRMDFSPYGVGVLTKEDITRRVSGEVSSYGVVKVVIGKTGIAVTGRKASMHIQIMIHYGGESGYKVPFIWDVAWIKRDDGWKVLEVTSVKQAMEL